MNMKRLCLLMLFPMISVLTMAQTPADCSSFKSPGCRSFNQMLRSRDSDLLLVLDNPGLDTVAYICFYPGQDKFFLASFSLPLKFACREDLHVNCGGNFYGYQYKNGILSDSVVVK